MSLKIDSLTEGFAIEAERAAKLQAELIKVRAERDDLMAAFIEPELTEVHRRSTGRWLAVSSPQGELLDAKQIAWSNRQEAEAAVLAQIRDWVGPKGERERIWSATMKRDA